MEFREANDLFGFPKFSTASFDPAGKSRYRIVQRDNPELRHLNHFAFSKPASWSRDDRRTGGHNGRENGSSLTLESPRRIYENDVEEEWEKSLQAEDLGSTTTLQEDLLHRSPKRDTTSKTPPSINGHGSPICHEAEKGIRGTTNKQLSFSAAVKESPYTHFICVPLTEDMLENDNKKDNQFAILAGSFFENVLARNYPGISSDSFQSIGRLHLTLCMLILRSPADVEAVVQRLMAFQEQAYEAAETRTILLTFRGVEGMTEDLGGRLVVTKPAPSGTADDGLRRLQAVVRGLLKSLLDADILSVDDLRRQRCLDILMNQPDVNFHATLINRKFQERSSSNRGKPTAAISSDSNFDTRSLCRDFRFFSFGTFRVSKICLCSLTEFSTPARAGVPLSGGFYKSLASIRLP